MNPGPRIDIIEFSDDLKEHIKTLNYEWLQKYFTIEKGDDLSLTNPRQEIIEKGGYIFYAKVNGEIVGTVSLLRKTDTVFELSKMAVAEKTRGLGIGKLLIGHCINFARVNNISKLILYSNTKLEPAIHLYRKYGFFETPLEPGRYERANIKMEKLI